jgi:hypothetical protein
VQIVERAHDLGAGVAVEVARRLVGQHQRRLAHDGPGDGDPLPLTARQLPGAVVHAMAEPHPLERGASPDQAPTQGLAGVHQPHSDVLDRGLPLDEVELLEHEPDVPVPQRRQRRVAQAGDVVPGDAD